MTVALPTPGASDVWGQQLNAWLLARSAYNVDDYVEAGDADDTAAAQRAITAAGSGGVVRWSSRVYTISGTLTHPSKQAWVGAGPSGDYSSDTAIGGTKLLFTGNHPTLPCIANSDPSNPISHASIANMTIRVDGTYSWIWDLVNINSFNIWSVSATVTGNTTGGFRTTKLAGQTSWVNEWLDFEVTLPTTSTVRPLDCDFSDSTIVGGKFTGGIGSIFRGTNNVKCCGVMFNNATGAAGCYGVTVSNETLSGGCHSFVGCEIDGNNNGVLVDGNPNALAGMTFCMPVFTGGVIRTLAGGVDFTWKNPVAYGPILQAGSVTEVSFIGAASTPWSVDFTRWTGLTTTPNNYLPGIAAQPAIRQGTWVPVGLGQSGAAVSLGPAGIADDTAEHTLATIPVSANLLLANGRIEIETLWSRANGGTPATATCRVRLGAAGTDYLGLAFTSANASAREATVIQNAHATNSQVGGLSSGYGPQAIALPTGAVDTTATTSVLITGQLGNAGDTLTLIAYRVTAYPQP